MLTRLFPFLIGASMAAAPMLNHLGPSGRMLFVPVCGGGPTVPIPIDGKSPQGDQSAACHAACLRKHPLDDADDLDD